MNHISKRQLITILIMLALVMSGCGNNKGSDDVQPQITEQEQSGEDASIEQQEEQVSDAANEIISENADLDAYAEVLDCYYYELKSQKTYDDFWINVPFNTMATYAYSKDGYDKSGSLDYTGYGFIDLNEDGINELVIGNLSDDEKLDKMIYLISTIHNNVPYGVLTSSETTNYYLCKDNKIGYEAHGVDYKWSNTYSLYEFAKDGLSTDFVEGIDSYKGDNDEVLWKSEDADGNETDISEEEAGKAKEKYLTERIQAELTSFSDYTPKNPEDYYGDDDSMAFGKGYSSWQEGYLAYLNENMSNAEYGFIYALIHVDDDDIPELVCDSGVEAGGCQILTFYDGQVNVFQTARLYFTYIEKSGLLCNSDGHMGGYYDYVYCLENGKWKPVFSGNYYDFDESQEIVYDEESGRYHTLHYEVDGEELDEETYLSKLKDVYDEEKAKEPESYLLVDDLMSYLKTGKMLSANHRYELFIEDCTWEEAAKKCEEKGGYLASMTCDEEFEVVDNLIRAEGKQNYCFYIGARYMEYSFNWTEPGLIQRDCTGSGYFKHWLDMFPSYRETLPDGTEIKEYYCEYIYRKSDDKFYINDVPDDVIAYYPEFKGCMGYICEYDE